MSATRWRGRCMTSVRKKDSDELNSLFETTSHMHETFQWRFELRDLFDEVLALGLSGPNPQHANFLECLKLVAGYYFSAHQRPEDLGVLALCVLEQRIDELNILVKSGIPLTCTGHVDMDRSPLHILALSESTTDYMRVRARTMPELEGFHIDTPPRTRMASTLLSYGFDPNTPCRNGCSALHLSALWSGNQMLRLLLDWGGDMELRNVDGQTVLMVAAAEGVAQSLELLLHTGADPNARNAQGYTPLSIAAKHNHPDAVRLLLQFNCNIHDKLILTESLYGSSDALVSYAAELGHFQVCQLLLLAGCDNTILKSNLLSEDFRNKIVTSGQFPEWLDRFCSDSVPSLKVLCRTEIRQVLGSQFVTKYLFLPLPDLLLDYLTIPEIRQDSVDAYN